MSILKPILLLGVLQGSLFMANGMSGCVPDVTPTPTPTPTPDARLELRVHEMGWTDTWLHYDAGSGWTDAPGVQLEDEGDWRTFALDNSVNNLGSLEWAVNDGADSWYPGNEAFNFRISNTDAWLKDGLIFAHDPTKGEAPANQLSILTINLHTYQESDAAEKLAHVAAVIAASQVDIVAFQECAQSRTAEEVGTQKGITIKSDNMVRLLVQDLAENHGLDYDNWFWDWSHYGFTDYEEGLAIMAKADVPLIDWGSEYVSASTSINDPLNSRKVVWGVLTTQVGPVFIESAHLSWGNEQNSQIDGATEILDHTGYPSMEGAFIVGDFNAQAGESGYEHMMSSGEYTDSYIEANPYEHNAGFLDATFQDGSRIDYVFRNRLFSDDLHEITAQRVFLPLDGAGQDHPSMKRVSDHYGVLMRYELRL